MPVIDGSPVTDSPLRYWWIEIAAPSAQPQAFALSQRALHGLVSRRWRVLPYQVASGQLLVAGPELPSDEMTEDLQRLSRLEVRFHLVTPKEFEELAAEYLS